MPLKKRSTTLTKTAEAGLEYATRGWKVFPCHIPDKNGKCSCGRPDCNRIGKHPKTRNGFKDGSTDVGKIERWFGRPANIAIATGAGLLVVDIDPKNGGNDSLEKLEAEHGSLPDTLTCITGSGGTHFYFLVDVPIPSSGGKLGDGIDVRCDGGYAIAPPSMHESGNEYQWQEQTAEPCEAPDWLLNLLVEDDIERETVTRKPSAVIGQNRNIYLTSQAGSMRRRAMSEKTILECLITENRERCRPPLDEAEVEKIAASIIRNYQPSEDTGDWTSLLKRDNRGFAKATAGNCAVYLTYRPEWKDALVYNEFSDKIIWKSRPPDAGIFRPEEGDELSDSHVIYASHWLSKQCGPTFTQSDIWNTLKSIAYENKFNPLTDWLNALEWDGKCRLKTWLVDYLDADNTAIINRMGYWWLISAVARALKPGCQADHVLVLEGKQGVAKTDVARILGSDYFLGTLPNLNNQYAAMHMQGFWIIEIPELNSIRGATRERVKEFLTQIEDVYKRPFDKSCTRRKRRCVFLATTNRTAYLEDDENRRYWPVYIKKVDRIGLRRDREQLFAEAVHLFKKGEPWHPDMKHRDELETEQSKRFIDDSWDERIIGYLIGGNRDAVTTEEVLCHIGFELHRIERRHQMRCSDIMKRLGWMRTRKTLSGRVQRCWVPTPVWGKRLKNLL